MPAERETGAEMVESIYRVAGWPLVAAMCGGIVGVYGRVKKAPVPLVGRSLKAAEATARWTFNRVYPCALKFEKPIMYVDSLACKGLDALENTVPIVKKTPDQMFADISDMVTRVKDVGVAMVCAAIDFGLDKMIQAAKKDIRRALQSIDDVALRDSTILFMDVVVDVLVGIPAEDSEDEGVGGLENGEENSDPALAPIVLAADWANKVRRRINEQLTLAKANAALDNIPTTGLVI